MNIYIYDDYSYTFDLNIKIVRASKYYEPISPENYNEFEVKRNLYSILQPIIDYQTEPMINLQWLFNLKYGERFK